MTKSKAGDPSVRHKVNPFVRDMVIPVGKKQVQITALGATDTVVVSATTGEVQGTHFVTHRAVDKEKFVKVYASYMALTFDLTAAGNKALRVLLWSVQSQYRKTEPDKVMMDQYTLEAFLEAPENSRTKRLVLAISTFRRGLAELVKAHIIAKAVRPAEYYVNPSCVFSGDRVAFTTLLRNKDAEVAPRIEKDVTPKKGRKRKVDEIPLVMDSVEPTPEVKSTQPTENATGVGENKDRMKSRTSVGESQAPDKKDAYDWDI